jgi:cyclic pyranopterin phosphate synthase
LLSFEEISELAGIFTEVGIEKVRLTGGEPLLRKDLPVLVRMLPQNPRIRDLALTTNGVLLPTLSSANSAVSRLIKNHSSNQMRGTMILPGETAAGSAGTQPCRGIAWLGHRDDHYICANILLALLPTASDRQSRMP